jgi:hypothetical protein
MRFLTTSLLAAIACTVAAPARAQGTDYLGRTWNDGYTSTIWNNELSATIANWQWRDIFNGGSLESKVARMRAEHDAAVGAAAPARRQPPMPTTTRFRRSSRDVVLAVFPPDKRELMNKTLAGCESFYAQSVRKIAGPGVPLDDLATSAALMVALTQQVYFEGRPDAPLVAEPYHFEPLREQMRDWLLRSGKLAGMRDVGKQLQHVGLVLGACLPYLEYNRAEDARDQQGMRTARLHALSYLRGFGLEPGAARFERDGRVALVAGGRY